MAWDKSKFKLSFRGAPLLLALAAHAAGSNVVITWPKAAHWSKHVIDDPKLTDMLKQKLPWLKRSYEQLIKNPNGRHLAQHILPYLAKVDITLHTDESSLGLLARRINGLPLIYTQTVAKSLSENLRIPTKMLPVVEVNGSIAQDRNPIRVIAIQPTNELELGVAEFIRQSGLSWGMGFSAWLDADYNQKLDFARSSLPESLNQISYRLEIVTEPGRLNALSSQGYWQIEAIQPPVPSHGYELPPNFNDGGLMEKCFDISAQLYGEVQALAPQSAQLFALWGHRQRAIVSISQQHLRHIAQSKNPFINLVKAKLSEKHPLLWGELGKLG